MNTTHKALIVTDVQNDFITGTLRVPGAETTAVEIAAYLDAHAADYGLVIATQDWHQHPGNHWSDEPDYKDSWPKHCEAYSWGAQLHDSLPQIFNTRAFKGFDKAAYSGFEGRCDGDALLGDYLREHNITEVDIVGIALDHCVKATAMDAQEQGFTTRVITSLTAAVSAKTADEAVTEMAEAGVEVTE